MPLTFSISREDMLRSKVVEPGWYNCIIKGVSQEAASTDGSTNTIVDFVVIDGPQKDVPLRRYFSEKAPGFAVNFFKACGAQIGEQGATFDVEKSIGRKMQVFVKNEEYGGSMRNRVEDFRPMPGSAA